MNTDNESEEAEVRRTRIECRRQTGEIFESRDDLKWLYFDLSLRGALAEWQIERDLRDLILDPILESAHWRDRRVVHTGNLRKQATRYIEEPLYHCTTLRDFFILRLMEALLPSVGDDPPPRKKNWKARVLLCVGVLMALPLIWIYVNRWTAVLALACLWFLARRWELQYEGNANNRWSIRHYSKHFTRESIRRLVERVRQGGFDEPTLIQQLELLDVSKTAPGSAVPLGEDGTPVRAPLLRPTVIPVIIPDVLYALLRLPRRNLRQEVSKVIYGLDKSRRQELERRWRKFIDPMLTYDEPQVGLQRSHVVS